MKAFDVMFIGAVVTLVACFIPLWLGHDKSTAANLLKAIGVIAAMLVLLIVMKFYFGFESDIFAFGQQKAVEESELGQSEAIVQDGKEESEEKTTKPSEEETTKPMDSSNEMTEKESTEQSGSGAPDETIDNGPVDPSDGFVLNDTYYSYDGKISLPSSEHQNSVVMRFTGVDVTGWEVTIGIPHGGFGIDLAKEYSEEIQFRVSSGSYSIQVFKTDGEKQRVYENIVEIDNDGEYIVDLTKARITDS